MAGAIKRLCGAAWKLGAAVARDYKQAGLDAVEFSVKNPAKGIRNGGLALGALYLWEVNPTTEQYEAAAAVAAHKLATTPPDYAPEAMEYLTRLDLARQRGELKYHNLGFFSIVTLEDESPKVKSYDAQYSSWPRYCLEFVDRVQDISVGGHFFKLQMNIDEIE